MVVNSSKVLRKSSDKRIYTIKDVPIKKGNMMINNIKEIRKAYVGDFLKDSRENKKLSQIEIATALNYSSQFISNWERGESLPPIPALNVLLEMYDIPTDVLIIMFEDYTKAVAYTEVAELKQYLKGV